MRTWDDNQIPLAFLITFRTYGTWLHGDELTSTDRFMNKFGSPRIPERPARESYNKSIMKGEPVRLNAKQRNDIEKAIREVCEHRNWGLKAINVRTNHVHVVVSTGDRKPEKALNAFKAYATRRMKLNETWASERSPWVDKGSLRWLWYEKSVFYACDYVDNGQGADLTEFDNWRGGKNPPANSEGPECDGTEEPTR